MEQPELTSGCLQVVMSGDKYDQYLVLQVLDKRDVRNRFYRLLLSDGQMLTSFTMVDPSLNDMVAELTTYTIIQVNEFRIIKLNNRRLLKINQFTVLRKGEETNGKIGDPYTLESIIRYQERQIMNLSPPSSQE